MRRSSLLISAALLLTASMPLTAVAASPPTTQISGAVVDPALSARTAASSRFVVLFGSETDLRGAEDVASFRARGEFVIDRLQATATAAQRDALALVERSGGLATPYWVRNVMVVDGDLKLADALAKLPGVVEVRPEKTYPLIQPVKPADVVDAAAAEPEWGVAKIGADLAWDQGVLGGGIVVGGIDTGVDVTHPALTAQYRGNLGDGTLVNDYNWFDPTGICGDTPCDNDGHGTHTMGTIVGGDGPGPFTPDIGVAPGARWIAAKGCEDFGCSESALLESGQFMLAPTDLNGDNPDPGKRPDIVSNSWGSGPGDPFYADIVTAWRAAGIIPVFSSGNPGPTCGEGGSPGDFVDAISVGATDFDDVIADFSGRGPSVYGKTNPNVTAPGVDIVSSVPGGGYEFLSGTSMAAPHVAGTLALMLSAAPELIGDPDGAQSFLEATAIDIIDLTCGGDDDGDPNNVYGEGRIDAATAVDLVANGGTLAGTVTDAANGAPIAGVRISAGNGVRQFSTFSGVDGTFRLLLGADMYTVSGSKFGYEAGLVSGVEIITDEVTTQDLALQALPTFTLRGRVVSAETGRSIARPTVSVLGVPVAPIVAKASGDFSFTLPLGSYTVSAQQGGCTERGTIDVELTSNQNVRIPLAKKIDDFGHGCSARAFSWVDPNIQTDLYGDDSFGRLRLPFQFPFYGERYSQVFISTNGFLSFDDPGAPWIGPMPIPSTFPPDAAIYPLWSDLVLDEDSSVGYRSGGSGFGSWFTVSIVGARQLGNDARVSFQVRLWQTGKIDLIYHDNVGAPGDGSGATIGLESPDGDAFAFSHREAVVAPNASYRFEEVPTGIVRGTISNANDGRPVAGAVITADPGGRSATTDLDGNYTLRLVPARYTLTIGAKNYEDTTAELRVLAGSQRTISVALAAAAITVEPTSLSAQADYGTTATESFTITNVGTAPLAFEIREREQSRAHEPLAAAVGPDGAPIVRPNTWERFRPPVGSSIPRIAADVTYDGPLEIVVEDPIGDAIAPPDLTAILGGSDGVETSIQLDFADAPVDLGGYVFIDSDQDITTGVPPEALAGLPTQELGVDYFVDLFGASFGVAYLVDIQTFEILAEMPTIIDGTSVRFDIPLEAIGDDGAMDIGTVTGNFFEPTDWAPDTGKGTIEPFRDAPWMSADPTLAEVAPGDSAVVEVTFGGVDPGNYAGSLVVQSNDPRQPRVDVAVDFVTVLPPGFGSVSGTISNARAGFPIPATITVDATHDGAAYPIERVADDGGTYTLFGPAGTWPVTVTSDGYEPFAGDLTIPDGADATFDVALQPMWPNATLDGGPLEFTLVAGDTATSTLSLGNVGGLADLGFTVHELSIVLAATQRAEITAPATNTAATTRSTVAATATTVATSAGASVDAVVHGGQVLILEDARPWDTTAIEDVLDLTGIAYDIAGSAELATINLSPYEVVFVANDQTPEFYDTLAEQMDRLTAYAQGGGYLWLGVAGWGFNGGEPDGLPLPGGGSVDGPDFWDDNLVAAPNHPIAAGLPDPFTGTSASHTTVSGFPDGTVIATTPFGDATLVEYELGVGRVLVVAQPVEFAWEVGQDGALILINSVSHAVDFEPFTDVEWLDVEPLDGTVAAGAAVDLTVTVSASGLEPDSYEATVVVLTDDPLNPRLSMPVRLTVAAGAVEIGAVAAGLRSRGLRSGLVVAGW